MEKELVRLISPIVSSVCLCIVEISWRDVFYIFRVFALY